MATAEAVKERPILFSAPMVRALMDGSKTQTRRIVRDSSDHTEVCRVDGPAIPGHQVRCTCSTCRIETYPFWRFSLSEGGGTQCSDRFCPYGQPGDRLWVRETFSIVPCSAGCEKYPEGFDPTIASVRQPHAPSEGVRYQATWSKSHSARWRPSIHMPRWASRLTLEITEVRVERLLDISEADKLAEGATPDRPFGTVWKQLHTKPGERFEDSPWVWAITFRRLA